VTIPVQPTRRARWRQRLFGTGPLGPAIFGAALVIALGFAFDGPAAIATERLEPVAPRRNRIERAPALGRFTIDPVLLRRLDGTIDGGRTVNGPGGAVADTSAVRLVPWLFQDVLGLPRRHAPWGIVLHRTSPVVLDAGVTMPPALTGFRFSPLIGGVDYSDPLGINLPLVWVQGYEDHRLTDHFRVRDFATHDGAPFARISPHLVGGLERMIARIGPLNVISGYRHPAYNRARRVGGALFSQHQAGQAADVWSPTRSTIEVARAAIQTLGCGIGIGLGPTTVHIDVRGVLSTWTYRGAPLSETAFDLWILSMCRGSLSAGALRAAEVRWLLGGDDREELSALMELPTADPAAAAADSASVTSPASVLYAHGELLREFARASQAEHGPGVVVVDLHDMAAVRAGPAGRMRYVRGGSPEARFLGATTMLEWSGHPDRNGRYLVYALKLPGPRTVVGVLLMEGELTPPAAPAAAVTLPTPEAAPPPALPSTPQWVIVLASTLDRVEANEQLNRWRVTLAEAAVPVALQIDGSTGMPRYRVTAGRYLSAAEAQQARATLGEVLPAGARVLRL
jgi:hypothetical protein